MTYGMLKNWINRLNLYSTVVQQWHWTHHNLFKDRAKFWSHYEKNEHSMLHFEHVINSLNTSIDHITIHIEHIMLYFEHIILSSSKLSLIVDSVNVEGWQRERWLSSKIFAIQRWHSHRWICIVERWQR